MTPTVEYFIGHDCSGHKYVVPLARKDEWDKWADLPEEDERAWDVPDYAVRLDGGRLVFSGWRVTK